MLPPPSAPDARILIVDDALQIAAMLERRLRDVGYTNIRATTESHHAVDVWREFRPDLVILDLLMPQVSGQDILNTIRNSGGPEATVPVLVLTSDCRTEARHAALSAGADDFLTKPFDAVELALRVRNLLERCILQRQSQAQNSRLQELNQQLRVSGELLQATINALSSSIVILDEAGQVIATSGAWSKFARQHGIITTAGTAGLNYLDACDRFVSEFEGPSRKLSEGIRDVIAGRRQLFELEYRTVSNGDAEWVILRATRFHYGGETRVVVAHDDITARKSTERELRETGELMNALLEHTPAVITVKDITARFLLVSRQFEEIVGQPRSEIIGKSIWDLPLPRETLEAVFEHDRQVLESGAAVHVEEEVPKNGRMRSYISSRFPLLDPKGRTYAVCEISTDITDKKCAEAALRESERRYRHLIETLPVAVYACDVKGRITLYNKLAVELWGRKPDLGEDLWEGAYQLQNTDGSSLEHHDCPVAVSLREGRAVRGRELIVVQPNGMKRFVVSYPDLIYSVSGQLVGAVNTLVDLTSRKKAELALTAACGEAERASRAKSEFLSRMSHELRTPLNAVLGFAQMLEMAQPTGREGECVSQILKAGRHLLGLINEVLDLSGIEAGRVTFSIEPVRLRDVAEETLDLIRPLAMELGLQLSVAASNATDVYVRADHQRLKQVVLNLVGNAVKYNRERGSVEIAWEEASDSRVRLSVRDTGPGIASEDLPRLFAPFERLSAGHTGVEGSGLGLSLSKRLIEAMGGAIGVESAVDHGSVFWVELPRSASPLEGLVKAEPPQLAAPKSVEGTLLYIEDNLANVQLLEHILAHRPGIRLLVAMRGKLGLELAREHLPNLILLDLHLPDMMGDEVLARLKGDAETSHIPVVMLTADATPAQQERLVSEGADGYLTKPIDVPQFLSFLENIFTRGK